MTLTRQQRFLVLMGMLLLLPSGSCGEDKASVHSLPRADKVVVEKRIRRLTLYSKGRVIKTYRISLGRDPVGPKTRRGDNRTPEGIYRIDYRRGKSRYHLALHVSYPNPADRARSRRLKVSPGGDIMIHGIGRKYGWVGPLHRFVDWTRGCIAVTNQEMEEIWVLVPNGVPVEIVP